MAARTARQRPNTEFENQVHAGLCRYGDWAVEGGWTGSQKGK